MQQSSLARDAGEENGPKRSARRAPKFLWLLLLAVALGIAALGVTITSRGQWPRVRSAAAWRMSLVERKLAGRLPGAAWADVVVPSSWLENITIPAFLRPGGACPVCWQTPIGGFYGSVHAEEEVLSSLREQSSGDHVYSVGEGALRAGDVVLDVGTHLGVFTRLALGANVARVIAIEADPSNVRCLRKTFAREIAASRVTVVEAAAWDRSGTVTFASDPAHGTLGSAVSDRGNVQVRAVTLDEVVGDLGLQRVDYVKMDIEGAERHALRGAAKLLREFAPRLAICTYHNPEDPQLLESIVRAAQPKYRVVHTPRVAHFY